MSQTTKTTSEETCNTFGVHPWQAAGLGLAPFHSTGFSEKCCSGVPDANGVTIGYAGQPAGTCDACGQGIRYCVHIKSADGREFVVGMDCAEKLDRKDNAFVAKVVAERKRLEAAKRAARKAAKEAPEVARIVAAKEAVRESFGGAADLDDRAKHAAARDALYDGPGVPNTDRGATLRETLAGQPHPSIKDKTLYDYVLYLNANASHSGLLRMAKIVEGAIK